MFQNFKLKEEHPELFRRVWVKIILHLGIGGSLFFSPPIPTETARASVLLSLAPLQLFGLLFIGIGGLLLLGMYSSRDGKYKVLRTTLGIAAGNALMWQLSLLAGLLFGNTRSMTTVFLWGYLTYKLFNLVNDPGFQTIQLEREVMKNGG